MGLGACCLVGCMMCLTPWTSALAISADEPYEFSKATLMSLGWTLYDTVWSDQPPIHTWLLSRAIRCFDEPVIGARLLAFIFSILLLFGFGSLIAHYHGKFAGCFAMVLLASAPNAMELLSSATLMVPVMSVGLLSVLAFAQYTMSRQLRYVVISGACMGMALQIKLTAVILLPILFLQFATMTDRSSRMHRLVAVTYWWVSLGILFALPFYTFTGMTPQHLLNTHFSDAVEASFIGITYYEWNASQLLKHPEAVTGMILSGLFIRTNPDGKYLLMPVAWLVSLVAIHSTHQPYWWYYSFHFSLAMCWTAAVGWANVLKTFWAENGHQRGNYCWRKVAVLILVTTTCVTMMERSNHTFRRLNRLPKLEEFSFITWLRNQRDSIAFICTNVPEWAFHAGIPIIPELAVVSKKRLLNHGLGWSKLYSPSPSYSTEPNLLFLSMNQAVRDLEGYLRLSDLNSNQPFIFCYTNETAHISMPHMTTKP